MLQHDYRRRVTSVFFGCVRSTLAFSRAHIDMIDANDANNGGAGNYPVHITLVEDTNGQKIGQEMVGAQWPYAFEKKPRRSR